MKSTQTLQDEVRKTVKRQRIVEGFLVFLVIALFSSLAVMNRFTVLSLNHRTEELSKQLVANRAEVRRLRDILDREGISYPPAPVLDSNGTPPTTAPTTRRPTGRSSPASTATTSPPPAPTPPPSTTTPPQPMPNQVEPEQSPLTGVVVGIVEGLLG